MEALEKDFEDFIDSEEETEEVLSEEEDEEVLRFAKDLLTEEEYEEVVKSFLEEDPDIDFDDVDVMVDENDDISLYEKLRAPTKREIAAAGSLQAAKARILAQSKSKSGRAKKKGTYRSKKKRRGAPSREMKRFRSGKAKVGDSFDPTDLDSVDDTDLSEKEVPEADEEKKLEKSSFNPYIDSDGNEVQLASYDASKDVTALVGDTELSEEFKEKATTIFEAAVGRQVEVHVKHLKETFISQLEEAVAEERGSIIEHVDSYLDYVVDGYMTDNKMEIESGIRSELTESFITDLKTVFASHYIDIPETKVDVLAELSEKVQQLETQLDEEISTNVQLKQSVSTFTKDDCVNTLSGGLTDTETEQLRELSKSLEFNGNKEDFIDKVKTIKEQYFPSSVGKSTDVLNSGNLDAEEDVETTYGQISDAMNAYTSVLSRTVKTQ